MTKKKSDRDIEKVFTRKQAAAKLRRLADSLDSGRKFRIQLAGENITVPSDAVFSIEHEREGHRHELEFQFKWKIK